MSGLGRPGVLAGLLVATAVLVHPRLGAAGWLPGHDLLVAALLLLCVAGLVARAVSAAPGQRLAQALVAGGLAVVVAALALDGLRGAQGTLRLELGRARNHFDEISPGGRSLGLRPLGFSIGFERVGATGNPVLAVAGLSGSFEVAPGRSLEKGGVRLARPRLRATGGVARLRLAMSDGTRTEVADLVPGQPVQAGGLLLTLTEYFPDFALDERQQPFSRSLEPRNPAALVEVLKDGARHRAFVLRSMPGVHKVEALGLAFSMLDVVPEQAVELEVHRQPFAPLLFAGVALLALGLALAAGSAARGTAQPPGGEAVLLCGALLAGGLLLADRARVLAWEFGVTGAGGRVALPGVGVLLGLTLLSGTLGTLLCAAARIAGVPAALPVSRAPLWAAVASGTAAVALAVVRVSTLPAASLLQALALAGLAVPVALLAYSLARTTRGRDHLDALQSVLPVLVVAVAVAAAAVAWSAQQTQGTYATEASTAAGSSVLLGLAALQGTGVAFLRRLAFLLAAVALLLLAA